MLVTLNLDKPRMTRTAGPSHLSFGVMLFCIRRFNVCVHGLNDDSICAFKVFATPHCLANFLREQIRAAMWALWHTIIVVVCYNREVDRCDSKFGDSLRSSFI